MRTIRAASCAAVVAALVMGGFAAGSAAGADPPPPRPALGLHVVGNHIDNSAGQRVRLIGFNNSGAEYACIEGWGIFDDDTATNTSVPTKDVVAMAGWRGANAVRLSLNEQCWLGIGGVEPQYGGPRYQHAVERYVHQLTAHGFAVILNLHLSAPGDEASTNQEAMPDSHSVAFWKQVARTFRGNRAVIFDLFNEPWPDNQSTSTAAWKCWRDGGCEQQSQNGGQTYTAVGMDQLIAAVRRAGAHNIVMAGGVDYASALNKWLAFKPRDPDHELVASVHIYSFNGCTTTACLDKRYAAVARRVPLVIGEFGPDLTVGWSASLDSDCPASLDGETGFDSTLLHWARAHDASWTAWTWNPWKDCWSLIKGFAGHPTEPWGVTVRTALMANRQTHRA